MTEECLNTIHHWPKEDRPRERLLAKGPEVLSDSELLAILLRTGVQGQSAVQLARKLLQRFGSLRRMSSVDALQWQGLKGLGAAKRAQIQAAIEIGKRCTEASVKEVALHVHSSKHVADMLMPRMRDLRIEVFKVVLLDSQNKIITIVNQSEGTVNQAYPIIREIFKKALENFAVSIICAHNHPSGLTIPSREDQSFTKRLVQAGDMLQVKVLDHIIIGDNTFYSFADEGLI